MDFDRPRDPENNPLYILRYNYNTLFCLKKKKILRGLKAQGCSLASWNPEAGIEQIQDDLRQLNETLSQNKKLRGGMEIHFSSRILT